MRRKRDGGGQRAEHAKLGASVAIVGVEGVTDEATVAGAATEERYAAYLNDGETHATLPKSADPATVTLDERIVLIDAKVAKGPGVKKKKKAAEEEAGGEESGREEGLGRRDKSLLSKGKWVRFGGKNSFPNVRFGWKADIRLRKNRCIVYR